MDLKIAKLFASRTKPFGYNGYLQPFDLIKRNFNKNVYSKKVVIDHFQRKDMPKRRIIFYKKTHGVCPFW